MPLLELAAKTLRKHYQVCAVSRLPRELLPALTVKLLDQASGT